MDKRLIEILERFQVELWNIPEITVLSEDVLDCCELIPYVESTDEDTVQAVLFYNIDHDARYETN